MSGWGRCSVEGVVQMAWDVRGGRRYYYRSCREGGRVRRVYVGTGPGAEAVADADAVDRSAREEARERFQAERNAERGRLTAALGPVRRLDALAGALAALALAGAGYHRANRGAWRRYKKPC